MKKWIAILTLVLACSEEDGTASTDECTTLDYESFGAPLLSEYCASCHGTNGIAPTDVAFGTLSEVQAAAEVIKLEVVTLRTMPPSNSAAQPTTSERAMLGEWLDCGAP